MPTDEERMARVVLSCVGEPGEQKMAALVAQLGAERVLAELRAPSVVPDTLVQDLRARLAAVDPERELERAARRGVRFVVPGDPEWPDQLDDLRRAPVLNQRGGAPLGLWVRGASKLDELVGRSVAIVGSRSSTTYGEDAAADIGAGLAGAGHCVVSGGAVGIDFAAHRGALAGGGTTVVVLACGVDRAYPAAHRPLFDHVAEIGAVVSECPIGGAPMRVRFLARNRLIAAMTRGTVVVEAALRSGALNTANWAVGMDRPLMGVPGPITSEPSAGVHEMIRARHAVLVTSAEEVLEVVGEAGQHTLDFKRALPRRTDSLTVEQRQVLDAVPVCQPASADSIAHTAAVGVTRVRQILPQLHSEGLIRCRDGLWRLAPS